jgi:hypothetical protein
LISNPYHADVTYEELGIPFHYCVLASNDVDVHAVTVEQSPREIGDIEDKHTLVGMTFPNMNRRTKIMFGNEQCAISLHRAL